MIKPKQSKLTQLNYLMSILFKNLMVFIAICFFILSSCLNINTFAANISIVLNTESTGTAPFNEGNCVNNSMNIIENGKDYCALDKIVRTNDFVVYRWDYSVNNGNSTNNEISQTLPESMEWVEIPFVCIDGSFISDNLLSLKCVLGQINSGSTETVKAIAKVKGDVKNKTIISTQAIFKNETQTIYSNQSSVIASAMPRWDLATDLIYSRPIQKIAFGQDGFTPGIVHTYPIVIRAVGGIKGIESLASAVSFENNLQLISPSTKLYNWTSTEGCKTIGWDPFSPSLPFSYRSIVSEKERGALNSGNINCNQVGNKINVDITNLNSSLTITPTQNYEGIDLPADELIASSFAINLWTPLSDIANSELPITNIFQNFNAQSVSGQFNNGTGAEEDLMNNQYSWSLTKIADGNFDKKLVGIGSSGLKSRDGFVTPNTEYETLLEASNNTSGEFTNVMLCDKIDNSVQSLKGETYLSYTFNGQLPEGYIIEYGQSSWNDLTDLRDKKCENQDADIVSFSSIIQPNSNMVRITIPKMPVGVYVQFRSKLKALNTFTEAGGALAGQPIPNGTKLWDFGAVIFPESLFGWYTPGSNCNMTTSFSVCDYATLTRAIVRVKKKSFRQDYITPTVQALNNTNLVYKLQWTVSSKFQSSADVEIEDILPANLKYKSASIGSEPDLIINNPNGTTTLKWIKPSVVSNGSQNLIEYVATTVNNLKAGESIVNTAIVKSLDDVSPINLRTSTNTVISQVIEGFNVFNLANPTTIIPNGNFSTTLNYENNTLTGIQSTDFISKIPKNMLNDSQFEGKVTISSINVNNSEQIYYTKYNQDLINDDPNHTTNELNLTSQQGISSIWCSGLTGGSCPSSLSEVTALRFLGGNLQAGSGVKKVTINYSTNANNVGNKYSHYFTARANTLFLVVVSNMQNIIVEAPVASSVSSSSFSNTSSGLSSTTSSSTLSTVSSSTSSSSVSVESQTSSLQSSNQQSSANSSSVSNSIASSSINSIANSSSSSSSTVNSSSSISSTNSSVSSSFSSNSSLSSSSVSSNLSSTSSTNSSNNSTSSSVSVSSSVNSSSSNVSSSKSSSSIKNSSSSSTVSSSSSSIKSGGSVNTQSSTSSSKSSLISVNTSRSQASVSTVSQDENDNEKSDEDKNLEEKQDLKQGDKESERDQKDKKTEEKKNNEQSKDETEANSTITCDNGVKYYSNNGVGSDESKNIVKNGTIKNNAGAFCKNINKTKTFQCEQSAIYFNRTSKLIESCATDKQTDDNTNNGKKDEKTRGAEANGVEILSNFVKKDIPNVLSSPIGVISLVTIAGFGATTGAMGSMGIGNYGRNVSKVCSKASSKVLKLVEVVKEPVKNVVKSCSKLYKPTVRGCQNVIKKCSETIKNIIRSHPK